MDPLSGPDGTAPARSDPSDDALAGTGAPPADRAASDLRLPALPGLGGPGTDADRAAVAQWMDEDRARCEDVPESERAQWTAPPRRVPPPRPVSPASAEPSGDSGPPVRHDLHSPGPQLPGPRGPADGTDDDEDDDEPPWVRERREEHEFLSQFGEWRAGAGPRAGRRRGGGVRPAPVLLLALVVAVLVAWALLH